MIETTLAPGAGVGSAPRAPRGTERATLVAWLDTGLRRGERGRLAREYPVSMQAGAHRGIWIGAEPVAHAMFHELELEGRGRRLRLGLIGNVYTDPAWRGRGLASRCIEACVGELARRSVPLALLWSDAWDFYAKLGFDPVGLEVFTALESGSLGRARDDAPCRFAPAAPTPGDWPVLEALYAAQAQHALRSPGDLERLARAPDCTLLVARSSEAPVAYAAAGRGDDFQGVVHEWAGDSAGVLACLGALHERCGAEWVLAGSRHEAPIAALQRAGARHHEGRFALARVLDSAALWRAIAAGHAEVRLESRDGSYVFEGAGECIRLDHAETLDRLFGAAEPNAAAPWPGALGERLGDALPWPLYLWGFDSI